MNRIISALLLALASSLAPSLARSADTAPVQVADNAPERHIVVPGDTLWGISAKFLKEPWRWPEVWRMNKDQIKNPHRIYPGDVIVLETGPDGQPLLRVAGKSVSSGTTKLSPKIYTESIEQTIPSIPPNVIEPFIAEPLVIDQQMHDDSARIVAMQVDRFYLGKGDYAFVSGASKHPEQVLWQVYRPGKPIPDPETRKVLGFEAFHLGTAKQLQAGEPASFEIVTAKQEMTRGDWMIPAVRPQLISYAPHKVDQTIEGRVASIYGSVEVGGRNSVVTINRGAADGLEVGHVLALYRNRTESFRDFDKDKREEVVLPNIRYGLLFVFRTFDRLSYALVVDANGTVNVNDFVKNP